MQFIGDFLTTLGNIISSFIDYVVSIIGNIGFVVELSNSYFSNIGLMFSWLPDVVITLIGSLFVFVIVYKFLGREG